MSIHTSLKVSGAGSGQRNVWSRVERIAALKKVGRWQDGDPVEAVAADDTADQAKEPPA